MYSSTFFSCFISFSKYNTDVPCLTQTTLKHKLETVPTHYVIHIETDFSSHETTLKTLATSFLLSATITGHIQFDKLHSW